MAKNYPYAIIVVLITLDRFFKFIAIKNPLEADFYFVKTSYLINPAVLGRDVPYVLSMVFSTVLVLSLLIYFWRAIKRDNSREVLVFGLVALGGVSNILDRYLYKGVIDYFSVFPHGPNFFKATINIADLMILGGIALWVIQLIFPLSSRSRIPRS